MFRTPAKKTTSSQGTGESPRSAEKAGSSLLSVRRSIGEWEAGRTEPQAKSPTKSPANPKPDATPPPPPLTTTKKVSTSLEARRTSTDAARTTKKPEEKYPNLTAEARACLSKAKYNLGISRNLKTEIKTEVLAAINRLFEIVKESEKRHHCVVPTTTPTPDHTSLPTSSEAKDSQNELLLRLQENSALIKENLAKMQSLEEALVTKTISTVEERTYASVAAAHTSPTGVQAPERATLHSVVVSSTRDIETGDEILERVRKAVDAKEGWVQVERVRKAKDRKIIMGCRTVEERRKIKERLEAAGENLVVEEVTNRDPLLILRDVLLVHSDEEVLKALRNQNRELLHGLEGEDLRMNIKFRRRTRNPHLNHIVLSASPTIWRRATAGGKLRIDLQIVRVEDQTPLVQCTRCLAYGHGKRFCKEPADLCSHCGGPHLRVDCPDRQLGEAAKCVNCTRAKLGGAEHSAFSPECPVRRKWDSLARASVAYC